MAALAVLAVLCWARVPVADVLDVRSTELRLTHWAGMGDEEKSWFLTGFALGWRGQDDEATAAAPGAGTELAGRLASADPGRRLVAVLLRETVAGRLFTGAVSGHDWIALDPAPRLALLHGFHGGAYGRAIWTALEETADDAILDAALARARRLVNPRLAFAPNLLFARLSDYYFYTNRRDERLVDSIAVIAAQIRSP